MVVLNALDDFYLAITFLITGTSNSFCTLISSWLSTRIFRDSMDVSLR